MHDHAARHGADRCGERHRALLRDLRRLATARAGADHGPGISARALARRVLPAARRARLPCRPVRQPRRLPLHAPLQSRIHARRHGRRHRRAPRRARHRRRPCGRSVHGRDDRPGHGRAPPVTGVEPGIAHVHHRPPWQGPHFSAADPVPARPRRPHRAAGHRAAGAPVRRHRLPWVRAGRRRDQAGDRALVPPRPRPSRRPATAVPGGPCGGRPNRPARADHGTDGRPPRDGGPHVPLLGWRGDRDGHHRRAAPAHSRYGTTSRPAPGRRSSTRSSRTPAASSSGTGLSGPPAATSARRPGRSPPVPRPRPGL